MAQFRNYISHIAVMNHRHGGKAGRFFDLSALDGARREPPLFGVGDPSSEQTRIHPLRMPCRTCRRGSIAMFEAGASPRGRRVACPVCAGTGFV
jgi:hypothetical protein